MNDPNPLHETLRQYVLEGVESRADALRIAQRFTLREMDEALHYDFLSDHAEEASAFLRWWLTQLDPFERVPASVWVGGQLTAAMVHMEHSYGMSAELTFDSLERVTEATAEMLDWLRWDTDGPDAEVDVEFADRLEALRPALMEVHRSIARIHAEAIPDRPWKDTAERCTPAHAPSPEMPGRAPGTAPSSATARVLVALLRPVVRRVRSWRRRA
jgi:hypothetical protein